MRGTDISTPEVRDSCITTACLQ